MTTRARIIAAALLAAPLVAGTGGCSSSVSFGDREGSGVRTSVGKNGQLVTIERTDGEGMTLAERQAALEKARPKRAYAD